MGAYSSMLTAKQEDVDAAKRLSDIINDICVHQPLEVVVRCWIAVRLSDGGYDGNLYDTRRDAVRHQSNPDDFCYLSLRFAPAGMQVQEAYVWLKFQRDAVLAKDKGVRIIDPEAPNGGYDPMMPIANEDVVAEFRRFHRRMRLHRKGR